MITFILFFALIALILYYIYVYKSIHYHYDKYGIKYFPGIPILGNFWRSTLCLNHFFDDIDRIYNAFPDERYVGFVDGTTPLILIRDPEVIKKVAVKDFDHFSNHRPFLGSEVDSFVGNMLFNLTGNKWHEMRTTLSPAFTAAKMRHMLPFMTDVANNIIDYLKEHSNDEIDVTDVMQCYTNDVIASAAFGLQVNSLKDRNNEFYVIGQGIFHFTLWQRIVLLLINQCPEFVRKLGMKLFPKSTTDFFKTIVKSTMEYREQNKVERPDMIQLLMEASKETLSGTKEKEIGISEEKTGDGSLRKWNLEDLSAQVFVFFVAGFDTTSSALVMCIHELAINPDLQERLYHEIMNFKERNGKLTFETVNELKYLEGVINETLRLWTSAIVLDRVCTKPYELPPPREGGKPYPMKPGEVIFNCVNSVHLDKQYYEEPEVFNPERFLEENKHGVKSSTYMPFGSGPRICIGARFAMLELKVILYTLLLNFKIVKSPKTMDPIRLVTKDFSMKAGNGTWVKFEKRD